MIQIQENRDIGYVGQMPRAQRKPLPATSPPPPKRSKNRILELTKERGLTYNDVADALGVSRSAIADLARGDTNLTQDWMEKLGEFFGVAPTEIIEPTVKGFRRVKLSGELCAGKWHEPTHWPSPDHEDILIVDDPELRRIGLYAGRVCGNSMNQVYPDKSIVVLSHVGDSPSDIMIGRRYHVRRTRADGQVEETLKTLVKGPDNRLWLKPESDDPAHQQWVPLDGAIGETIELIGRVQYSIKRER